MLVFILNVGLLVFGVTTFVFVVFCVVEGELVVEVLVVVVVKVVEDIVVVVGLVFFFLL